MIYAMIYGLFAACCIPFRLNRKDDAVYLDKSSTDWIRGIAILIVVIHHGVQHYDGFQFLYPFQTLGYGAVAIFLLLSGYGLGTQYQKKANYLHGFLSSKIIRLYVTFWCAYSSMYIASAIGGNLVPIEKVIQNVLTLSVLDTPTWYIKVQAGLYIIFFLIFRLGLDEKRKISLLFAVCGIYVTVCVLLGIKQYWWFTVLWFPVGVLLAYRKQSVERWLDRFCYPCVVLSAVVLMAVVVLRFFKGNMGYPVAMDIAITVSLVLALFALVYQIRFMSRPVQYIGKISLELYLVHSMLLTGYMGDYALDSVWSYVLYIGVSIGVSIVVKHLSSGVTKLLNKK